MSKNPIDGPADIYVGFSMRPQTYEKFKIGLVLMSMASVLMVMLTVHEINNLNDNNKKTQQCMQELVDILVKEVQERNDKLTRVMKINIELMETIKRICQRTMPQKKGEHFTTNVSAYILQEPPTGLTI